ncbi:anaerobic nitric oxide reductase flavorubredoxin [Panicum miliaceum]|uniref:Anaerobic nitric oxide reductase flavorubredoxin n=1 Tax=Panicum miliaceum TaxID=4540 RepID=A0A3L6PP89_PANMI|nr:anaerobic nitric oxide reductase flavorubredoxin [Panicum miliaceum]
MALACTGRLIHPGMVSKNPRTPPPPPRLHLHTHRPVATTMTSSSHHFALHSVDVSKDDKPLETPPPPTAEGAQQDAAAPLQPEEDDGPKLDPRRFEEKFAVLNTGIHECRSCGYRYDQAAGDPSYPVPPGLPFAQLPDDWRCPTCGAAQSFFESKSVEIAGFAQNQQFGLGGNSLTSGQKGLLIYGSLLLGFLFFISGYFLQ